MTMSLGHKNKWILYLMLMILLVFNAYGAHFICGQIDDARDGTSPAWRTVKIYMSDALDYSVCSVNPADSKYCCDLENLNEGWSIGSTVYSVIEDDGSGFYTDVTSTVASGNGYDVIRNMNLEGVIIFENLQALYETENISIDVTIKAAFSHEVNYSIDNGEWSVLCNNCTAGTINLYSLFEDDHTIAVRAEDAGGDSRQVSKIFTVDLPEQPEPYCGDYACGNGKVNVCHMPGSNAERTLCLSQDAVETHLGHGDYCGSCIVDEGSGSVKEKVHVQKKYKKEYKNFLVSLQPGRAYNAFADLSESSVTDIRIWVAEEEDGASIILREMENPVSHVDNFDIYSEIDIVSDVRPETIAKVEYVVKIEKAWLDSKGYSADEIIILNEEGKSINIVDMEEKGEYYYLSLRSNLLGGLIIGASGNSFEPENYISIPTGMAILEQPEKKVTRADTIRRQVIRDFAARLFAYFLIFSCCAAIAASVARELKPRPDTGQKNKPVKVVRGYKKSAGSKISSKSKKVRKSKR